MKVLVTGGNGFIGSVVVRTLLGRGHEVRCLLRPTSQTGRIDGLAWERAVGDVRDAASLRAAAEGRDAVVHLASLSSWNDIASPEMTDVVVGGTRNVLDAARAAGARTVFVSTAAAINGSSRPRVFDESADFTLDDPALTYAHAKRAAEALCREAHRGGQHVVTVNPAEVYGPNDTSLVTAATLVDFAKSSPVMVCNGGTAVVHADDVALGIVRAMEDGRSGERYILAGENLDFRRLADLTLALLGLRKRILTVPNPVFRAATKVATAIKISLPYNPLVVPYATRYWFVDASKARQELGVEFRPARAVLEPTLAWLKEAGHIS
jgi:dihydroflavonol-4-reductase